jgi:hypothetical protein
LVRSLIRRCVQEASDFWVLYVIPGLPAALPWRWAWSCYRVLSRAPVLLEDQVQSCAGIIERTLPGVNRTTLRRRLRLLRMLDFADLYLARGTPLSAAPGGHFGVEGAWPIGPFVAVSFHYGNGMWMLRDLLRKGRRTVVIAAPFEPGDFRGRRIYLAYSRTRHREMERSAGHGAAYRPRVREKLLQALSDGDVVMSLLDLPPRLVPANQQPVRLLDQQASLPTGVFQLAAAANVPVVPFWVELDVDGIRKLVIGEARGPHDIAANLTWFAALLDTLIRRDPAAWYFWSEWPTWMPPAEAVDASGPAADPSPT